MLTVRAILYVTSATQELYRMNLGVTIRVTFHILMQSV